MAENSNWQKVWGVLKSGWVGLFLSIFFIALLFRIFAVEAPFMIIFAWVAFFIGVPTFWSRIGGGVAAQFWTSFGKNGFKIALSMFVFLIIRAVFTRIVVFTPFDSYLEAGAAGGAMSLFGFTPEKVIFESLFLLIFGMLTLEAVFEGLKGQKLGATSAVVIGLFILLSFLYITYKNHDPAQADSNYSRYGFLGGTGMATKDAMFGRKMPPPEKKNLIRAGTYPTDVKSGRPVHISVAPGLDYDLKPTDPNSIYSISWGEGNQIVFDNPGVRLPDKKPSEYWLITKRGDTTIDVVVSKK